jgi:hypothetical protein
MASTLLFRAAATLEIAVRKAMLDGSNPKTANVATILAAVDLAYKDFKVATADTASLLNVPASAPPQPAPGVRPTPATAAKQMEGQPIPAKLTDAQRALQIKALTAQIAALEAPAAP